MENYYQGNSVSSIAQNEEMFRALREGNAHIVGETESPKDKGEYVGEDCESDVLSDTNSDDGLGDIWNEMTVALECSKDATEDALLNDARDEYDCEHSFILKDDVGDVCRTCGFIKRGIETIIDYNLLKDCSFVKL